MGQGSAREFLRLEASAAGRRVTLAEFVNGLGETARKLIVGGAEPADPIAHGDDFVLRATQPHTYRLDSQNRILAFDPETFTAGMVASLPKSVRRAIESTDVFIVGAGVAMRRTVDILNALIFDSGVKDLVLYVGKEMDETALEDRDHPFFLIAAKLVQLFKNRAALYRLADGMLVHCSRINLKVIGSIPFENIETYFTRIAPQDFFSQYIPVMREIAPALPGLAAGDEVEIVGSNALRDKFSIDIQLLGPRSKGTFPQPEWILDLSEAGMQNALAQRQEIATAESAIYNVYAHALVRGSNGVLFAPDKLAFVRQLDLGDAQALLNYLKQTRNWINQAEGFHCNIYFAEDKILLGEKGVKIIDDHFFLVTPDEYLNYGMWLVQAVPALHHCEASQYQGALLCPYSLDWQKSIVDFVAPNASRRLVDHQPGFDYVGSGALSFVGSSARSFFVGAFEKTAFAHLRDRALAEAGPAQNPRRIYVSRFQKSAEVFSNRVLVNEIELIIRLQELGFDIVAPEQMDFRTQIQAFAQSDIVIGPGGAGMFNCVFCRPGATIVTIESNANWVANHCALFGSLGLNYSVVFGQQLDAAKGPHSPWRLDVDGFLDHLKRTKSLSL